jgi:hypothetical protein
MFNPKHTRAMLMSKSSGGKLFKIFLKKNRKKGRLTMETAFRTSVQRRKKRDTRLGPIGEGEEAGKGHDQACNHR